MKKITIAVEDPSKISDGYHTFEELYDHRISLFLALMWAMPETAWISKCHSDGEKWEGWFIAGMQLPAGDISYHINDKYWDQAKCTGARVLDLGIKWDGHTSSDVLKRLSKLITG